MADPNEVLGPHLKGLLAPHRQAIDALDRQIIALVLRRLDVVVEVGEIKHAFGALTRDLGREKEQMKKVIAACAEAGHPEFAIAVILAFRSLIESSVRLQMEDQPDMSGTFYCLFCEWVTAGVPEPTLHWKVCPVCCMPVLPKEMFTLPEEKPGTGWGR